MGLKQPRTPWIQKRSCDNSKDFDHQWTTWQVVILLRMMMMNHNDKHEECDYLGHGCTTSVSNLAGNIPPHLPGKITVIFDLLRNDNARQC